MQMQTFNVNGTDIEVWYSDISHQHLARFGGDTWDMYEIGCAMQRMFSKQIASRVPFALMAQYLASASVTEERNAEMFAQLAYVMRDI